MYVLYVYAMTVIWNSFGLGLAVAFFGEDRLVTLGWCASLDG